MVIFAKIRQWLSNRLLWLRDYRAHYARNFDAQHAKIRTQYAGADTYTLAHVITRAHALDYARTRLHARAHAHARANSAPTPDNVSRA